MSYLFPIVFMANSQAMTVLLIVLGLAGRTIMVADVAVVQGATLALFYALSANARNLILHKTRPVSAQSLLVTRILLLLPIGGVTFWLSTSLSGANSLLSLILIVRRGVEWLGEVHLSEMERAHNRALGWNYLVSQSVLLLVAILWILCDMPFPFIGLLMWAFVPLLFSARFIRDAFCEPLSALRGVWQRVLPHVGSTTVIGVTVYVFRLLIILIVGKAIAGDLFTAFALGGILGSVFASSLGPSFALHESRNGSRSLPLFIQLALYGSLAMGTVLFLVSIFMPHALDWAGKTGLFWKATSLSMIGGVVMVYAQIIRNRFLQHHNEGDVFGPDVLMNILIIAAVPFSFYLVGVEAMAALYLLSAMLAFLFYKSCEKKKCMHGLESASQLDVSRIAIAAMLLFPLFFQVSNGFFRDPKMIYDAGGMLIHLPVPVSVIACFVGVLILRPFKQASRSLIYLFSTFLLMIVSTIISSHDNSFKEQNKLILMVQFILPMFGLILGEAYETGSKRNCYSIVFLSILVIIVSLQLFCTWSLGFSYLHPYVYFFSIYQHLQYVPVIFVSAYLIAFYDLWQSPKPKIALMIMAPIMGIYTAASLSLLAMFLLLAGLFAFAAYYWIVRSERLPVIVFLLAALMCGSYVVFYAKEASSQKLTFLKSPLVSSDEKKIEDAKASLIGPHKEMAKTNTGERIEYWIFYAKQVSKDTGTFLAGHAERPSRALYPSAHNYYLDFIYNFGILALLPMLILLAYTVRSIYLLRREIIYLPPLLGFSGVLLFLLLVDNFFKVGLRQPYPGIFTYFLWGVLLSKLSFLAGKKDKNVF